MNFNPAFFDSNVKNTYLYSTQGATVIPEALQALYERIAQVVGRALSSLGDWLKGADGPTGYVSFRELKGFSGDGTPEGLCGATRLMRLPQDLQSAVLKSSEGRQKEVAHCLALAFQGNDDVAYMKIEDIQKVDSLAKKITERDQRVDPLSVGKFFRQLPTEVISILSNSPKKQSELIAHCLAHLAQKKSPA